MIAERKRQRQRESMFQAVKTDDKNESIIWRTPITDHAGPPYSREKGRTKWNGAQEEAGDGGKERWK